MSGIIAFRQLLFVFPTVKVIPNFGPGFVIRNASLLTLLCIVISCVLHDVDFQVTHKKLYHEAPPLGMMDADLSLCNVDSGHIVVGKDSPKSGGKVD